MNEVSRTAPTASGCRAARLAGLPCVESFVRIDRHDGTQDLGDCIVAPADAGAQDDRPDLMLSLIQDSNKSTARGVEPLGREAFVDLAQAVAASVKRRVVGP